MVLASKHLVVKKSTIPGAGKGLFTKVALAKGTRIIEYKGKISTWKEANHKEGMNAYIYYINRNHVIDSSSNKNLARYANDAKGSEKVQTLTNNCKYVQDAKFRVFIEATKNIPAQAEILVPYGKEYWDILMSNKMELEMTKKKNDQKKLVKKVSHRLKKPGK